MIQDKQLPILKRILYRSEQEVIYLTLGREVRRAWLMQGRLHDVPLKRGVLEACYLAEHDSSILVIYNIREEYWVYYQWSSNFDRCSFYHLPLSSFRPVRMRLSGQVCDAWLTLNETSYRLRERQSVSESEGLLFH